MKAMWHQSLQVGVVRMCACVVAVLGCCGTTDVNIEGSSDEVSKCPYLKKNSTQLILKNNVLVAI